ncbi:MAG: sugar phosphate isomerase/epimerase [Prevotellaceae bacterium]|jgi:sugar phosphate isomerase/epimerase|nr:sugar phosphate isomerase/epimerase [Prevotellaceae bacterium]
MKGNKWTVLYLTGIILLTGCQVKSYEPEFGVCTKLSNYQMLSVVGYDFVEESVGGFLVPDKPDSVFRNILEEQRKTGAKVVSCNVFFPGHLKMVGETTMHEELLARGETALKRAQIVGMSYIVLGSGRSRYVPEGYSREKARQQFVDFCQKLAPIAQKYNIVIVIEPLNSGETNLINTVAEGAQIVESVNHPNIQLLCDIYHMMRENEPEENIATYGKYIRHCHIAEKEGRTAPGTEQGDFTPYFAALKKIGYKGGLSIEGRWENLKEQAPSALAYMKQQFESLK